MASREEQYSSSDEEGGRNHRAKRRKGPKACDVCRRKKIRCDPDPSGQPERPCVNCGVFKTECTYTYIAKKRRTQQAYIDSLQNRLRKAENLLKSLAPDIDLSKELDDDSDITHIPPGSRIDSSIQREPRSTSPPKPVPRPSKAYIKPDQVIAHFNEWRNKSSDEEDDDEEFSFVPLPAPASSASCHSTAHRFHGKSSGIDLIHKVIDMKRDLSGSNDFPSDSGGFPLHPDPWDWETRITRSEPVVNFDFPPMDLIRDLTDLFFRCCNCLLPILHRPSFEASIRDGLHTRNSAFGAVVLLMCAAAARWSEDPRVLPQLPPDTDAKLVWSSAGWDFYFQVHARYRRNFLHATSVFDLQMIALGCIYLQGVWNPSPAWQMAGMGLRMALDVGVHRRNRPDSSSKVESELWKRTFWTLVVLDRMSSTALGRPCAIWEEDINLDLPLEVDDEYMTPEAGFKQPPGKPSSIVFFNSLVKLTQILIGALRTVYPITKSKSLHRIVGPEWEQDMVAALDSSLNSWIENMPEHLRWDPNRENLDLFFFQSTLLQCNYYYVQIVVHRPYITSDKKPTPLAFPSLAICTNAARSCAHVLDVQMRRGAPLVPMLNSFAFTSAVVLLFNIWGTNKSGARVDWQSQVKDVHACMNFIKQTEGRWRHASKMGKILRELVFVGEFPLPAGASPPTFQPSSKKRTRDSNDSGDLAPSFTPDTDTQTAFDGHGLNESPFTSSDHPVLKQESLLYDDPTSYVASGDPLSSLNLGDSSLPNQPRQVNNPATTSSPPSSRQNAYSFRQQQQPPPIDPRSAQDVLTALDTAYFVEPNAPFGDGVVMDVAQHTFDVWGSTASGFQWDEWQPLSNIVQNTPQTGFSQGGGEQGSSWSQF